MICNEGLFNHYVQLFLAYEKAIHDVDARKSLDGTLLRIYNEEGYKFGQENTDDKKGISGRDERLPDADGHYTEKVLEIMSNYNLVHYQQIIFLRNALEDQTTKLKFEIALSHLFALPPEYEAAVFHEIVQIIGARFDILAFLFFLKDRKRFLPIRSRLFDIRFRMLGVSTNFAGHCTWQDYQTFIEYLKEIQTALETALQQTIELLDAHSFLWILPQLEAAQFEPLPEESPCNLPLFPSETGEQIQEGGTKQITVNAYERNPQAVMKCKQHYLNKYGKLTCQICGFDFGKFYGENYANKIHIHHIEPVSKRESKCLLDPTKDLIPVCPNCHMVLHANDGITIEDLKALLANKQDGKKHLFCKTD